MLYDPDGDTWTYTSPKPLVFVRAPIDVDRIDGDTALLSERSAGRAPTVVTVGAAELLGTEYEVERSSARRAAMCAGSSHRACGSATSWSRPPPR